MKTEKIFLDDESEAVDWDKWFVAGWKDRNEIFKTIDNAMKPFGLELVVGDNDDANYYFRIVKRE